jgi:hypothetical protein
MAPHRGLCFAPAVMWNLHTTQPRTLPQLTMRLSISPVCCKQRIERIEWLKVIVCGNVNKRVKVNGNSNVKEIGPGSTVH